MVQVGVFSRNLQGAVPSRTVRDGRPSAST